MKKSTASASRKGGTAYWCSAARWSGSLLVTRTSRRGQAASTSPSEAPAADDLLEVVEDEEHALRRGCALRQRSLGAEHLGRGREHELGIPKRRQLHPPDAVGVGRGRLARSLRGQARLAAAAGARERQEPNVVAAEEADDVGQLRRTADERGRGNREVRLVERLERRELGLAELVDPFRRREILEPVVTEVGELGRRGESRRRRRDEHLAAVPGRCDPCRAVDVLTHVALLRHDRGPCVHAHAD